MSILETSISKNLVLRLYHLSPSIGTEVLDIHLSKDLGVDVIDFLSDLLVERKLIFFRDQAILMQQHIEFARCFGDVEIHPFTKMMKTIQRLLTWIMIVIALQRLMSGTLMLRGGKNHLWVRSCARSKCRRLAATHYLRIWKLLTRVWTMQQRKRLMSFMLYMTIRFSWTVCANRARRKKKYRHFRRSFFQHDIPLSEPTQCVNVNQFMSIGSLPVDSMVCPRLILMLY